MRIGFISAHHCIRVDKMALPLLDLGHHIDTISQKDGSNYHRYKTRTRWGDLGQLIDSVKLYRDHVDLFHVHNEPSWPVTVVKEHTDKPVVLDVHDSFLARSTPEEAEQILESGKQHSRVITEERTNFQIADALVFPGEDFANLICSEFKLNQPRLVLPSYCTTRMQVYSSQEWLGGLVYEGRVDLKEENKKHHQAHGFRYCEYEELAKECHKMGMDLHFYARNDKPFLDIYEKISFTHTPQSYDKLLGCVSRHDWGLVGNIESTPEWEIAFPNKLFEYISAGVPVVAMNAKSSGDFVVKHGLGISVKNLDELARRWKEHTGIRKNIIKTRQKWVMENHIGSLVKLYERLVS